MAGFVSLAWGLMVPFLNRRVPGWLYQVDNGATVLVSGLQLGAYVKAGSLDAAMKVGVWQKDMRIIAEFARELDCPTPLFAATAAIYDALCPELERILSPPGRCDAGGSLDHVAGLLRCRRHRGDR